MDNWFCFFVNGEFFLEDSVFLMIECLFNVEWFEFNVDYLMILVFEFCDFMVNVIGLEYIGIWC